MRKTWGVLIVLALVLSVGCSRTPDPPSAAEPILKGEHQLRKMAERVDAKSEMHASFFLIAGGVDSNTSTNVSVKFAWEMNDGTYAISSLPLEKIRIKFDEKATTPTIKFRWRRWYDGNGVPQTQHLMDDFVSYALVTVRESDWPVQVSLPMNGGK